MGHGELAAIERLRRALPPPPPGETWIGDDAAVVAPPGAAGAGLLLAADLVVAGVHADLGLVGLDDLGWKALAVNVSDIAAMGARPAHALVTVAGPPGTRLEAIYEGLSAAASRWGCALVGGDLANSTELVVSVAITGAVPPDAGWGPVLRSGARPGDGLFVTGPLGSSAAGLRVLRSLGRPGGARWGPVPPDPVSRALAERHRRPLARVEEGLAAAAGGARAMIDVSDGLAADLRHLARASGVGLALERVPVAEGATEEDALGGGEDYELAFAAPDGEAVLSSFASAGLAAPLRIGTCTASPGEHLLRGGELPRVGWQHDWA